MKTKYNILFFMSLILASLLVILLFESFQIKNPAELKEKRSKIDTLYANYQGQGYEFVINFESGKEHNHPTFVIWVEDLEGNFIQTLFVTKSLATGIYNHASAGNNKWKHEEGLARRPATLPYYLHKRGIKADDGTYLPTPENPIPDAFTGATPKNDFILYAKSNEKIGNKFRILLEINQPWDWNEYWNNSKYMDDIDYKTSCQPAVVYAVTIDLSNNDINKYYLNPIGHSHYSGKDGNLYTNLTTFSTALNIVQKVEITLK